MLAAVLLLVSGALIFYILIGYPLLLACSWGWAPPVRKDLGFSPAVSVLLAVHNGASFLHAKLESVLRLNYRAGAVEVIVVSDGSTDQTDAIAESFAARGVRLLRVPRGGKAAALNAGLKLASGEIVLFTDVRQSLDPDALLHLAANFADPSVGVATGELRYLSRELPGRQADLELYWRYELWARSRHSQIDSMFGATGCLYAIRKSLAPCIAPDTLSDDVLIPALAFLSGHRVIFDCAAKAYDYPAGGGDFWRKLRTLAGLWQVFGRVPALFTGANRMRLHFLSHKFGRLVLPWAILLAGISTFFLPRSDFRNLLLGGATVFTALALADYVIPPRLVLKRVSSPARSFVEMNAAALLSIVVFFVPPRVLWRTTPVQVGTLARGPSSA